MEVFRGGVTAWTKADFAALSSERQEGFAAAITALGQGSAVAQELHTPITSIDKFLQSDHVIYLLCTHGDDEGGCDRESSASPIGLLRTGTKHLFAYDREGKLAEKDCTCVLDFYVREAHQRKGFGLQLFSAMLERERVPAAELAYDRPSPKLVSFLRKHFALDDGLMQPNRFLVFDPFFR